MKDTFTNNILKFINKLIKGSSSLSDKIRNTIPLHKIMYEIVKDLFLNELELVYLAIYLDRFSWQTEGFSVEDTIFTTALVVKVLLLIKK